MKIAISGTIGSGKSTVSNYLRSLGYVVLDCDKISRDLQEINRPGYMMIKASFDDVIASNGEIDRNKLANIVFNDEKMLQKLNDIMHPLIKKELCLMMALYDLVFVEVPLLFETDFYTLFDKNVLIVSDKDITIKHLIKRGLDKNEAIKRINSQMPDDIKIKKADYVIYNNGSFEDLELEINKWLERNNIC